MEKGGWANEIYDFNRNFTLQYLENIFVFDFCHRGVQTLI